MRLIDADALKELFPDNGEGSWTYNITARMYIDNAPTSEVFAYTKNGEPLTTSNPPKTLIDKVGPVFEQIAETATNFFEDETIRGLLEEGEE